MQHVVISETSNYGPLVELFIRNGLEFTPGEAPPDAAGCWKVEDEKGGLMGGCLLVLRQGEYVLSGIALEPAYRQGNIGSNLLSRAMDKARVSGATRVYLVARAPGFFRKHGFLTMTPEEAPGLFECSTCPQRGHSCHPEFMKREW